MEVNSSSLNKLMDMQQVRTIYIQLCRHQCLTIDLSVITFSSILSEDRRHPIREDMWQLGAVYLHESRLPQGN